MSGGAGASDWEAAVSEGDREQSLNELLASYAAAVARTAEEGGALQSNARRQWRGRQRD